MFTGIIEEIGTVLRINQSNTQNQLTIKASKILGDVSKGQSISTNGVCLTVVSHSWNNFIADVMPETMQRTNFGELKIGSKVNLERAMAINSRFGGHIVSGHIDGTGIIVNQIKDENAVRMTIEAKSELLKYVIEKGSIAIDGVSLTVTAVSAQAFDISVIPTTASDTTLLKRRIGDRVNLECDVIGKYVEKLMHFSGESEMAESENEKSISSEFLKNNGFM